MEAAELIQLATLISVIIGVIGLIISIRAYRRQVGAQFLLEYTRRVDELIQSLPPNVWALHIIRDEPPPPPSDELSMNVLRCLNLVAQLHYFSHKGYMPPNAWRRGKLLYARILRSPLFRREWVVLQHVFETDRRFCRFVEKIQRVSPMELARLAEETDDAR